MTKKIIYLAEYRARKKREEKYNSLRESLRRDNIELPEPPKWLKKLIDESFIS